MPTLLEHPGCQAGVGSALVAGAQIAWRWPPFGELPVVESDSRGGTSQGLTDFFLPPRFIFSPLYLLRGEKRKNIYHVVAGGELEGVNHHILMYIRLVTGK